jgi:hypothetical protein
VLDFILFYKTINPDLNIEALMNAFGRIEFSVLVPAPVTLPILTLILKTAFISGEHK